MATESKVAPSSLAVTPFDFIFMKLFIPWCLLVAAVICLFHWNVSSTRAEPWPGIFTRDYKVLGMKYVVKKCLLNRCAMSLPCLAGCSGFQMQLVQNPKSLPWPKNSQVLWSLLPSPMSSLYTFFSCLLRSSL